MASGHCFRWNLWNEAAATRSVAARRTAPRVTPRAAPSHPHGLELLPQRVDERVVAGALAQHGLELLAELGAFRLEPRAASLGRVKLLPVAGLHTVAATQNNPAL